MSEQDDTTVAEDAPVLTTAADPEPLETTTKPKPRPRRKPCKVKGCEGPAGAKGYCAAHHRRWLNAQRAGAV